MQDINWTFSLNSHTNHEGRKEWVRAVTVRSTGWKINGTSLQLIYCHRIFTSFPIPHELRSSTHYPSLKSHVLHINPSSNLILSSAMPAFCQARKNRRGYNQCKNIMRMFFTFSRLLILRRSILHAISAGWLPVTNIFRVTSFDHTSFIKQALALIESVSWRASRHYGCECCSVNRVTQWWKMFAAELRSTRVQTTPNKSSMATLSLWLDIQQLHSILQIHSTRPATENIITASSDKSLVKAMQPIVNEMDQDSYEWSRSSYSTPPNLAEPSLSRFLYACWHLPVLATVDQRASRRITAAYLALYLFFFSLHFTTSPTSLAHMDTYGLSLQCKRGLVTRLAWSIEPKLLACTRGGFRNYYKSVRVQILPPYPSISMANFLKCEEALR